MKLRILYQNTMQSDRQSDREAIDRRVDQILGATETKYSTKFVKGENSELLASLTTDDVWYLVNFMGGKFSALSTQLMKKASESSPTHTASKMIADFGETVPNETFIRIEITTTKNEFRELLQIPHRNP